MSSERARSFWAGLMAKPDKAMPRPQRASAADFLDWADAIAVFYEAKDNPEAEPHEPDPPDDDLAYLDKLMADPPPDPPRAE